jgi:hypothetical protein
MCSEGRRATGSAPGTCPRRLPTSNSYRSTPAVPVGRRSPRLAERRQLGARYGIVARDVALGRSRVRDVGDPDVEILIVRTIFPPRPDAPRLHGTFSGGSVVCLVDRVRRLEVRIAICQELWIDEASLLSVLVHGCAGLALEVSIERRSRYLPSRATTASSDLPLATKARSSLVVTIAGKRGAMNLRRYLLARLRSSPGTWRRAIRAELLLDLVRARDDVAAGGSGNPEPSATVTPTNGRNAANLPGTATYHNGAR